MLATKKAIFTHHIMQKGYVDKAGNSRPERYELNFIDAATHEAQKLTVAVLPDWVDERKENTDFLQGDLTLNMEVDQFKSRDGFTVYRSMYSSFDERELVSLS